MRLRLAAAIGAVTASLLVAGCGGNPAPVSSSATPSTRAGSSALGSAGADDPGQTLPMPSGAIVARDPSLLALLPTTIAGTRVAEEPDSFGEAVKDPAFVASVDRAVFAIAVSAGDLASGVIAHVRPGVYSDKMFADWRSSYDEGACAQSSGVVAHADETLASRTTYVTTCGGGLRVYHTYLTGKGVIVSLFSTGAQDFGGQLMASIQG